MTDVDYRATIMEAFDKAINDQRDLMGHCDCVSPGNALAKQLYREHRFAMATLMSLQQTVKAIFDGK